MRNLFFVLSLLFSVGAIAQEKLSAEQYVERFNHFVNAAQSSSLSVGMDAPQDDYLIGVSEAGDTVYVSGITLWDRDSIGAAFDCIEKGIADYPSRLDMRFGDIYFRLMLIDRMQCDNFDELALRMESVLDYGRSIDYRWEWNDGPIDDGRTATIEGLQGHMSMLFDFPDFLWDSGGGMVYRRVAAKMYEFFPEELWAVSNYAIALYLDDDYESAVKMFGEALRIQPDSAIDASNLARCYMMTGDKERARSMYEQALGMGSATDDLKSEIEEILRNIDDQ